MKSAEQVGTQRYRESFGRYYDEVVVGDIYEHRPGRTITETDNIWFTLLTMNQHPLHFDNAYAAKTEFKRTLVNSCLDGRSSPAPARQRRQPEGDRQSRLERRQAHRTGIRRR